MAMEAGVDSSRFDIWTRRRFGIAAGGLAAVIAGLVAANDVDAKRKNKSKKKRRRRKRCRKLLRSCTPGGKPCCRENACEPIDFENGGFLCCKPFGKSCSDGEECCSGVCLTPENICQGLA
jgi:hypothetical protein